MTPPHSGLLDFGTLSIALPMPAAETSLWLFHTAITLAAFLIAGGMPHLLRAGLRTVCILHLTSLLFMVDGQAPYSFEAHTRTLCLLNQWMLILLPAFMCLSHFIVERSNERRVGATTLLAGYLVLCLPVKLVVHALAVKYLTVLVIPLLFMTAGPVFDVLALTALYAWAVSWRHGIRSN